MGDKRKLMKEKAKKKAKLDISEFFKLAKKDKKKADLYVHKARRLAMKYRIKLNSAQKRKFCKHCYCYLTPGENCRVRTRDKKLVYYCLNCKKYTRFGIKS